MSDHALLDLALLALLLVHAVRGWRIGALISLFGLGGLLGGALLGLWGSPRLVESFASGLEEPLPAVLVVAGVLCCAVLGESILGNLGVRLRLVTRTETARRVDSGIGALASMLVLSILVTLVGSAVRPSLPPRWASAVNHSRVLPAMDALTPNSAGRLANQLTDHIADVTFPRVFSGLSQEPVLSVPDPDGASARTAAVARAGASIVRVTTASTVCSQGSSGSGWVVAGHRVVTNAHVVAGATQVWVQVGGKGRRLPGNVVAFDPDLDLAILDVPRLTAPPLARAASLDKSADAVVAGFPQDQGYTLRPARIRGVVQAKGDDIYGGRGVRREVYSVASVVLPGNSGGPLLTTDGRVAGTVFARSLADSNTGYVLTDAATDHLLDRAASLDTPVDTQECTRRSA
ncbi:MarP family serine protease [Luteococcus sp. Sow4_B9]|uniref:MarP family serine protease n=1 Tax=Luteococcus sp. Sow4_B9 TaxID=3438792 RepID=UPI003F9B663D